jgi:hypothetical protein
MTHLVDIGAHSMQEALWIAYQLDKPLSLGLENMWTEAQRERQAASPAAEHYRIFIESDDQGVREEARSALIACAMTSNFVADIEQVFRSFAHDEETKNVLAGAVNVAWKSTIALHRTLASGDIRSSA